MPAIVTTVIGVGTKLVNNFLENKRKNQQISFQQQQAALMAAYTRDKETTLTFQEWALQNQKAIQDFNTQSNAGNTNNYLIAGGILLTAGVIFLIFFNRD